MSFANTGAQVSTHYNESPHFRKQKILADHSDFQEDREKAHGLPSHLPAFQNPAKERRLLVGQSLTQGRVNKYLSNKLNSNKRKHILCIVTIHDLKFKSLK